MPFFKVYIPVLLGVSLVATPLSSSGFVNLQSFAMKCLLFDDNIACEKALLLAESLQIQALEKYEYPCQTMLLGLQADLIMQQLGKGRGAKALNSLEEIRRVCGSIEE